MRYASSTRTDSDLTLALASTLADCLAEIGQPPSHETSSTADNGGNKYKQMFRLRSLHLLAFFALLYVGVEVTLGGMLPRSFGARKRTISPCRQPRAGWIVEYIQRLRGGGPDAGYISSGFFGGTRLYPR